MSRRSLGSMLRSNPKWDYLTSRWSSPSDQDDCSSHGRGSPCIDARRKEMGDSAKSRKQRDILLAFMKTSKAPADLPDMPAGPCCTEGLKPCQPEWDADERIHKDVKMNYEDFMVGVTLDPERLTAQDSKGATFLHHAARAGRKDLMQYLVDRGLDINEQDIEGNAPLHWAVEGGNSSAVNAFLQMGADTTILNHLKMAPLHLACDLNDVDAIQVICSHPDNDINIRGEFGQTPVHYCAMKDNLEATKKLIEFSPKLCWCDYNGVYPIHCAATHASRRVLDILLTEAEKCGYQRWQLLSMKDKEKNTALHSAVNGGCENAVQVCLEFGAKLDVQQDNRCTPLHLACGQGALRIVEIMLSDYKTDDTLGMRDIEMMTPLHKAAMFDHVDVVKYLIDQGADIDVNDNENRSPLLLAASKCGWRSVRSLLQSGADYMVKDAQDRNLLHIVICNGGNLRDLRKCSEMKTETFTDLLNERDSYGCTPMHYATQRGNLKCVESLIALGATVNLKNKDKQSPLHFAAKYGRYNSIKRLLDSKIGPNIINDPDGEGKTALHIASFNGHKKVVQLLMLRGALIHKDYKGRSPLHLAAMAGFRDTMDILLSTHSSLLDQPDDLGNTPILSATQEGQSGAVKYLMDNGAALDIVNCNDDGIMDIVFDTHNKEVASTIVMHERWDELLVCTFEKSNPLDRLIQHMPDVFMKVLDRCQTASDEEPSHPDYWRKYEFRYLQMPVKYRRVWLQQGNKKKEPLCTLNSMVRYNRVELLSHPVTMKCLDMKWKAYGALCHNALIGIYIAFLALLTSFVCTANPKPLTPQNSTNLTEWKQDPHLDRQDLTPFQYITVIIITIFCASNILKELGQIIQQKHRYFTDMTNYLEWLLYGSCLLYLAPFLQPGDGPSAHLQWVFGSLAIFMAWFNLLLYQQRVGSIGIYVVMFLHILKTLIKVMIIFMILIIAFSMSFYILMKQETNHAFDSPLLAIMRVITMMMGELDYINSFVAPIYDADHYTQHYTPYSFIYLLALCVLLPILLMNLLIGLAVGDIAAVQRDAQLKRLAMQVDQYTALENRLPLSFIERVDKDFVIIRPNKRGGFLWMHCVQAFSALYQNADESNPNTSSGGEFDPRQMHGEVNKLKKRLKDVSSLMEKQYDLLRLVVQKMEIRSEADERDEGACDHDTKHNRPRSARGSRMSQVVRMATSKMPKDPSQNRLSPDSGGHSRPGSTGRISPSRNSVSPSM